MRKPNCKENLFLHFDPTMTAKPGNKISSQVIEMINYLLERKKTLFLSDFSVLKYPLITPFILSLNEFSFTL